MANIFYHFISNDDKKLHVAPFRCKLTINFNYLQGHIVSFKLHLIKLNLRSFFLHTLQNCLSMSSIKIAIFWITALLYHQIKNKKKHLLNCNRKHLQYSFQFTRPFRCPDNQKTGPVGIPSQPPALQGPFIMLHLYANTTRHVCRAGAEQPCTS